MMTTMTMTMTMTIMMMARLVAMMMMVPLLVLWGKKTAVSLQLGLLVQRPSATSPAAVGLDHRRS